MVEPSRWSRASRLLIASGLGLGISLSGLAGCSVVPQSRLDDCRRLSQTLQAENNRLRDTAVGLRAQNRDLNQRAVDEARRLQLQEEEIQRLSQSISAYQEDRDQLAAAFERLKGQIRSSSPGPSADATTAPTPASGLGRRLEDLARAHPGWEFDPRRGVLTIPAGALFEAGSDRLRDEARGWLEETSAALRDAPEARDVDLLVVGRNDASAVRRAGHSPTGPDSDRPGRSLGHARAARVRDLLARAAGIDPARIEAAGFEVPHEQGGDDAASTALNRRIEIHLRPRATATSGASAAPGAKAYP
jgi:chemotaxis protein MotB